MGVAYLYFFIGGPQCFSPLGGVITWHRAVESLVLFSNNCDINILPLLSCCDAANPEGDCGGFLAVGTYNRVRKMYNYSLYRIAMPCL